MWQKWLPEGTKRIWSHLLKKSLTEKFIFCAVGVFKSLSNIYMIELLSKMARAIFIKIFILDDSLQTHHVYSKLKRRGNGGNGLFHVVSMWNTRGVFVGLTGFWIRLFFGS